MAETRARSTLTRAGLGCVLVAASMLGCRPQGSVVRISGGREEAGPFVSPEAYAAYLEGALLEEAGNEAAAEAAYERAVEEDSSNASAWARLGVLRCTRNRTAANAAFARAIDEGPDVSDVWVGKAECALRRSEIARASQAARRALALDPESPDASAILSTTLERSGKLDEASRVRVALSLWKPRVFVAPKRSDLAISLVTGDYAAARAAAFERRISLTELALAALELGQLQMAGTLARRIASADPGDTDAWVVAVVVADLEGDQEALRKLSGPREGPPPGAEAARWFEALLARRFGTPVAESWRRGLAPGVL